MSTQSIETALQGLFATGDVLFWQDVEADFMSDASGPQIDGVQMVHLEDTPDTFTEGQFLEHAKTGIWFDPDLPPPAVPQLKSQEVWSHSAKPFQKSMQ